MRKLKSDAEVAAWLHSDKVVFLNTTNLPYRVLHKIHPFKQEEVGRLISMCPKFPLIKKIVVFGSSITSGCTPWSDLDIAIDWECKVRDHDYCLISEIHDAMLAIQKNSQFNVDIIQLQDFSQFEPALQNNIKKGITIYEKHV